MALASLGRLGQRAILGQSWILDTFKADWDSVESCLQGGLEWIPIG